MPDTAIEAGREARAAVPDSDAAIYLAAVGARLRLLRAQRGMPRRLLAARSGVSERFIAQMEAGRGNASLLVLRALASALGIPPRRLIEDGDAETLAEAPLSAPRLRAGRVALVGLRGAGKSALGRLLARRRGVPFVELDGEIARAAGLPLAEIFDLHGQAGFRRLERAALDRVMAQTPRAVIATSGSIVAESATWARLRASCLTVWLRARPEEHMRRVLDQGDMRPMADNRQAMADLRAILSSREPLYARADLTLDTSDRTLGQSADDLGALIESLEHFPSDLARE